MKRYFFYALIFVFTLSCKKENNQRINNFATNDPSIIQDQYGRQLILRGLNTSSSAKGQTLRNPWIVESDVEREAKDFGFNFVRYLIFWDAIEPQKDVFDEAYLDRIEERVNWYTSRGMYVMLDMHQDLYSIFLGGDGAPEWACRTNGVPPIDLGSGTPWWLKNIDPTVINSWINFWSFTAHKDLQEHYLLAWQKVAERFDKNPYVIGYDLMNEPWGGDLAKVFLTGEFEREQLTAFYKRLIPGVRNSAPDKYIFFEPTPAPVTFGAPSNLGGVKDTRNVSKLVYAPHCYPYDTHEGLGYSPAAKNQLRDWEKTRNNELKKQGSIPLVCGEFGLTYEQDGFDTYLNDFTAMADRNLWHWAYWSNDLGGWSPLDENRNESPILPLLIRAYPKATAGKITNFNVNIQTNEFVLEYVSQNKMGQATEIFIPKRRYPNGWNVSITGLENYTKSYDEASQVLSILTNENGKTVSVKIESK